MAGALVGGAFLSAFLQVAFDRVASREVLDYLKGRKLIDGLLQKLKIELMSADAVLIDAEEKQITNPAVKKWLDELKDAVYVADDLLDEIAYEALRCKLDAESTSKDVLCLKEVVGRVPSRPLTTSCPEEYGVFGREKDKEAIFKKFQSDDASVDGICVVPIVDEFPVLEEIGRQIVQKCKGLPLAAKALGGLLRSEQDPREWTKILKSDIWDLPEGNISILPALRLSYHYLPSHLKRCFVYCSILPKDYEFKKEELVLLWMAEDLLQQSKENGRMEEIGVPPSQVFADLLGIRSFNVSVVVQ
uniref:Rx N-terminal domain-containing protein n=1 Tax=Fagus sylvatica TaxID=28930 RepID=A0A2N9HB46_FAGSY